MIKGVQRRVVEVKLCGSKIYESACFVLRQGVGTESATQGELINEAKQIINSIEPPKKKKRAGRIVGRILFCLLLLAVGAALGFALSFLF